jgi:predicted RNase H-like HicB family nuclease
MNGISDTTSTDKSTLSKNSPTQAISSSRIHNIENAKVRIMKYPVALLKTEDGYSVSCPGLPGCWSQGSTEAEALANIRDAITEYLEVAKELAGERVLREVEIPA